LFLAPALILKRKRQAGILEVLSCSLLSPEVEAFAEIVGGNDVPFPGGHFAVEYHELSNRKEADCD
jgi:hypothetical protein